MLRSVKYGLYGAVLAGLVGGTVAWTNELGQDRAPARRRPLGNGAHHGRESSARCWRSAGFHPGAHDLVAPSLSAAVPNNATIVYKRGRLLHLDVDGSQRLVWTTAPTVAQALGALGYATSDFTSVSRSRRLPLGATDIALRTPKRVTVTHDGIRSRITTTDADGRPVARRHESQPRPRGPPLDGVERAARVRPAHPAHPGRAAHARGQQADQVRHEEEGRLLAGRRHDEGGDTGTQGSAVDHLVAGVRRRLAGRQGEDGFDGAASTRRSGGTDRRAGRATVVLDAQLAAGSRARARGPRRRSRATCCPVTGGRPTSSTASSRCGTGRAAGG